MSDRTVEEEIAPASILTGSYEKWAETHGDFHRALGQVAELSARLESLLAELLYPLLSSEREIGEIVVAPLTASRRLDLLGVLVSHLPASEAGVARATDLRTKLKTVFEERNHLVHGTWDGLNSESSRRLVRLRIDPKHARRLTQTFVTTGELYALAERMHAAGNEVVATMLALKDVSFGFVDIIADKEGNLTATAPRVPKRRRHKGGS
jgi:hypothetical protein